MNTRLQWLASGFLNRADFRLESLEEINGTEAKISAIVVASADETVVVRLDRLVDFRVALQKSLLLGL